jgi:hypothetical protein
MVAVMAEVKKWLLGDSGNRIVVRNKGFDIEVSQNWPETELIIKSFRSEQYEFCFYSHWFIRKSPFQDSLTSIGIHYPQP